MCTVETVETVETGRTVEFDSLTALDSTERCNTVESCRELSRAVEAVDLTALSRLSSCRGLSRTVDTCCRAVEPGLSERLAEGVRQANLEDPSVLSCEAGNSFELL